MLSLLDDLRKLISSLRKREEGDVKGILTIPHYAALDVKRTLASKCTKNIEHIFPIRSDDFDPGAFELAIWRRLAGRGIKVSRLYVIPHVGFAKDKLRASMADDASASVLTSVITVSRASDALLYDSFSESITIDGAITLRSAQADAGSSKHDAVEWIASSQTFELERAKTTWDNLWLLAAQETSRAESLDLEEPLVMSADLINGVAPVLCSGDHIDRSDCSWYHGTWQYMRLLDLVSTPTWHHEFYKKALTEAFTRNPQCRILISGTADYSLLAYVASTAKDTNANPEITVLDQCATPLFACRWFARQAGFSIETAQIDINDAPRIFTHQFDILASDAFLTRFSGEAVINVIDSWRKLCCPDSGRVVTTIRIHDATTSVRDEEKAVTDFVERARMRLPKWQGYLKRPSFLMLQEIERYGRRMVSNRIGGESEIASALTNGGFEIVRSELGKVPGELYPTVYLRVVAR